MPYIATQVSTPLTPEKEKVLKERFGQAIELLGKNGKLAHALFCRQLPPMVPREPGSNPAPYMH